VSSVPLGADDGDHPAKGMLDGAMNLAEESP
jgi:hypothetical protein